MHIFANPVTYIEILPNPNVINQLYYTYVGSVVLQAKYRRLTNLLCGKIMD